MAEIEHRLAGINHFRASAGDGPGRATAAQRSKNLAGLRAPKSLITSVAPLHAHQFHCGKHREGEHDEAHRDHDYAGD